MLVVSVSNKYGLNIDAVSLMFSLSLKSVAMSLRIALAVSTNAAFVARSVLKSDAVSVNAERTAVIESLKDTSLTISLRIAEAVSTNAVLILADESIIACLLVAIWSLKSVVSEVNK